MRATCPLIRLHTKADESGVGKARGCVSEAGISTSLLLQYYHGSSGKMAHSFRLLQNRSHVAARVHVAGSHSVSRQRLTAPPTFTILSRKAGRTARWNPCTHTMSPSWKTSTICPSHVQPCGREERGVRGLERSRDKRRMTLTNHSQVSDTQEGVPKLHKDALIACRQAWEAEDMNALHQCKINLKTRSPHNHNHMPTSKQCRAHISACSKQTLKPPFTVISSTKHHTSASG